MISIYSSAFNLIKNNFNYKFSIDNFCNICDEVVIAVNTSEDNTLDILKNISTTKYNNLKIIETNFSYNDPLLDGKIKNTALQNSSMPIKIGLDMDEYIPIWQKDMWYALADILSNDSCDCYMIPSVNLYKDCDHYFSITPKWYLHKSGLFRGPVNFAKKEDGHIDINKSDTCELIDAKGDLAKSKISQIEIEALQTHQHPFVVHMGYLSFDDRLLRNKNFWKNHWLIESGGEAPNHKIHSDVSDFTEPSMLHKLKI